jgi:DNA polymerase-1
VLTPESSTQPRPGAVWIFDAQNLLHRYHHATPVQVNGAGQQVHAVRGLAALVTRVREQHGPKCMAAVFDAGHSGRAEILPEYKAGRSPPSLELTAQIEMACEHLPAKRIGLDTIRVEGFEADDVIAVLALSARAGGDRVYIVTGDKDLLALVSDEQPEIAVYNRVAGKSGEGWRLYREADVRAKFGVAPNRVHDLLALTGDDADGIPGVGGVGPKTAAELLTQYGNLETLLSVISTVRRASIREALRASVDQIRLARRVLEFTPVPPARILESINASPSHAAPAPRHP